MLGDEGADVRGHVLQRSEEEEEGEDEVESRWEKPFGAEMKEVFV